MPLSNTLTKPIKITYEENYGKINDNLKQLSLLFKVQYEVRRKSFLPLSLIVSATLTTTRNS